MRDYEVLQKISALTAEKRSLLKVAEQADLTTAQRARMREIEASVEQCWDLLRQRRAKREFGQNPDEASLRPLQPEEELATPV
jgi:DNA-binding transcriptional regulator PaaX